MSTKKFGIVAGLVFALSIVLSPAASACSLQDLSSCDNDGLMALIVQMLAGQTTTTTTTTTTPTITGIPAGFQFNTNLKLGSTGNDVKYLQIFLNSDSATAVGNAGSETSYFGSMTQAAVVKFQNKYASEVLTPYGLSAGTGFFGTSSRAKANAMISSGTTTPVTTLPEGCTSTSGFSTTTGQRCDSGVSVVLPTGCTSTAGFSPVTGERCDSGAVVSGTPTTGAGMTVAVASGSPTGTTLVEKQAIAPLAKYTLVNSDSVEAKITKVELQRTGVSGDTTLKNVYLYDGDTRLTDAATISQGKVTFNNPNGVIVIPAGTSKVITVVSDIDAGTSGQTVGVSLTGLTANVDLKSTMPVTGGVQTIATATLAGVVVGDVTPSSTTSIDAGTSNYTVFSAPLRITERNVDLKGLTLKMIGSIPTDALENIQLYVNGVAAGNATVIDSNNMVRFTLDTPVVLQSGNSTVEIRANVVKGSSRDFSFTLENAADLVVVDSVYNVNITAAAGIPATTGTISIAAGTVSVTTDATFSATTVTSGVSNATLAKYNFKAFGEDVKVSYLKVTSSRTLDNLTVYVNGAAVTSTQNVTGGTPVNFSLGSSLVVPANTTVSVEVRGDTKASGTNIPNGQTIAITLNPYASNNAQGVTSSTMSTVPSSDVSSQTLKVGTGAVVLDTSSAFASGIVAPNTANQKIGSYVIQASDAETIRISNVKVLLSATNINNLSNLYIKYGSTQSTPVAPRTTNNFPVNIEVAANQSVTIDVYVDAGSTITETVVNANDTQTIATATPTPGADGNKAAGIITVDNTWALGGTATAVINGVPAVFVAADGDTTNIAIGLAAAINANPTINTIVTATNTANVVNISADLPGTGGNSITLGSTATTASGGTAVAGGVTLLGGTPNTPQASTVTPANVEIGDIFTVVIGGTSISYTATAATEANVIAGLTAAISANGRVNTIVTATNGGTLVNIVANVAGTAGFTLTASEANGTHSANSTVQSTLGMSVTGILSNSTINVTDKPGQTMTVKSPTLDKPVLAVSSSPVAQYMLAGSEAPVANFHFVANDGSVNITEAKFSVNVASTINQIKIGDKVAPVIGGTATITGLNYTIPAGLSGRSMPVTVRYNTVGTGGSTTANTASIVTLTEVKYVAGNTTTTMTPLTVAAPTMRVVGGIPTVSLAASSRTGLAVGSVLLGEVTVSALSNGGPVRVTQLPVNITAQGVNLNSVNEFVVKIGSTDIAVDVASDNQGAGAKKIKLGSPYTIAPGESAKFEIWGDVTTLTDAQDNITTSLGNRAHFLWNDVEGGVVGHENGAGDGLNGTLVTNYSTTTTSTIKR